MATLTGMIAKLRDDMNAAITVYNEQTEALNDVRSASTVDAVRESVIIKERAAAKARVDTLRARINELDAEAEQDRAIEELQKQRGSFPTGAPTGTRAASAGTRTTGRFLNLRETARDYARQAAGTEVRALVATGSTFAPAYILEQSPIDLGKPATSLLDVIPQRDVPNGEYSYLRQTVRTNNAAPVAVSATKPTSVYTLERKSGTLQVVAHLSEPIHELWLGDVPSLEQFISDEMGYGIAAALEDQLLNGSGTAPELDGIIGASTGTQAYATSPLVTIRTGLAQLEAAGLTASAVVLASADWLAIETATLTAGNYVLGLGTVGAPLDAIKRTVWGVPVVVSTAHTAGTAVLLSADSVGLVTDGGVQFTWGRPGDTFTKNQVVARAELRAQVEVFRPHGVIVADLTA